MKFCKTLRLTTFAVGISVILFHSCKVSRPRVSGDLLHVSGDAVIVENNSPKIVFLNCSLIYDSIRQNYAMSLVSKDIVDGRLNEATFDAQFRESGDFRLRTFNRNSDVLIEKSMRNPLEKTVEFVDGSGNLNKRELRMDSTLIFLRLPLTPETSHLIFDLNDKKLLTIDIKK